MTEAKPEPCNCGSKPWNPLHPFSHLPDCPILRASVEAMHCKADEQVCRGESYCSCQCLKCLEAWATPVKPARAKVTVTDAEAPKILGVQLQRDTRKGFRCWFGPLLILLLRRDGDTYSGWVSGSHVSPDPLPLTDCVAAIERELLAIKKAIP